MAFDPKASIMIEPYGDVTLSIGNDDSIIANYLGRSLPITLRDTREGGARSETLKEGTGFKEGVVTGFKAFAIKAVNGFTPRLNALSILICQ